MKFLEIGDKISYSNIEKTERQKQNLMNIGKIASEFHKKADTFTKGVEKSIDILKSGKHCIIIEVAHQPNFMPYYGVWKKAVFADYLAKLFNERGIPAVALFGLVDQDISTSSFLYQNKIPFLSKKGYKNIGFKIKGKDKWKMWCKQPLPSKEDLKKFLEEVIPIYINSGLSPEDEDIALFKELFYDSYLNSKSFSDANSNFYSKVCNRTWNLNIVFFPYSFAQKKKIFLKEFEFLLSKSKQYIEIYNRKIEEKKITNLKILPPNYVPFWYHCECEVKVRLEVNDEDYLEGVCLICGKKYVLEVGNLNEPDLNELITKISPEAVSRDLIFAIGLGTNVYVSGLGGGLIYGKVSNAYFEEWKFIKPLIVSYKSKDRYFSTILSNAIVNLNNLEKMQNELQCANNALQLIQKEQYKIKDKLKNLKEKLKSIAPNDKEFSIVLEQIKGINEQLKNLNIKKQKMEAVLIKFDNISRAINITSSILDEFFSVGFNSIIKQWIIDLQQNDFDIEHYIYLQTKGGKHGEKNDPEK